MTAEILHLTAQIELWLNKHIARHLAAQAARLTRQNGPDGEKQTVQA